MGCGGSTSLNAASSVPYRDEGAKLERTQTRRTVAASSSLSTLQARVEQLERRVDTPSPGKRALTQLQVELDTLDGDVDAVAAVGLTGAMSVRATRKSLVNRVEQMHKQVDELLQRARTPPSNRQPTGADWDPTTACETAGSPDTLVRIPTKNTKVAADSLDQIGLRIQSCVERAEHAMLSPATPKHRQTLATIQTVLCQLEDALDQVPARGLGGESPLLQQRRILMDRNAELKERVAARLTSDTQRPRSQPQELTAQVSQNHWSQLRPIPAWDANGHAVTRVLRRTEHLPEDCAFVPLESLFDAPEWADYLISEHGWALTEMRYEEFQRMESSRVLSYRWENIKKFHCRCTEPSGRLRDAQDWEVPIDFLRALKLTSGPLWVDFLCHLDDKARLTSVLEGMGTLYVAVTVLPLYLYDFTTGVESLGLLDVETVRKPASETTKEYQQIQNRLVENLHRGWIFQEFAFGPLDSGIVSDFIDACLRLPEAAVCGSSQHSDSGPSFGSSPVLLEVLRWRPYAVTQLSTKYAVSSANYPARSVVERLERVSLSLKAMSAEMLGAAVETIVGRQVCDLSEPFTALALVEGFGTTDFTKETDAVFATLQTAAALQRGKRFEGIGPCTTGPIGRSSQHAAAMRLLDECWKTLLCDSSVEYYGQRRVHVAAIKRSIPGLRTAGLGGGWLLKSVFTFVANTEAGAACTIDNPNTFQQNHDEAMIVSAKTRGVILHGFECSEANITVATDCVDITIVRNGTSSSSPTHDIGSRMGHTPIGSSHVDARSLLQTMSVEELRSFISHCGLDSGACFDMNDLVDLACDGTLQPCRQCRAMPCKCKQCAEPGEAVLLERLLANKNTVVIGVTSQPVRRLLSHVCADAATTKALEFTRQNWG
jgi:hypothetical protein